MTDSKYNGKGATAKRKAVASLQTAIANAKRLNREIQKVDIGRPIFELNPYTNVHELLEAIDKFIKDNHF